jgi:hypothetical protein
VVIKNVSAEGGCISPEQAKPREFSLFSYAGGLAERAGIALALGSR